MSPHSIITLLTTFALIHITNALFYTDSKQNDFPRIGKRRHIFPSDAWSRDSILAVPTDPTRDMSYGILDTRERQMAPLYSREEKEISFMSRREQQKPTSSFSKAMYNWVLGRKGYGGLSKDKLHASRNSDVGGSRSYY